MTARKAETAEESKSAGLAAVGQQLAAARESQELTIESVASELNLTRAVVQALEEGDESQLPALTFVRGYIRTYARRLGMDDAELIAQLPDAVMQQTAPLRRSTRFTSRRRRTGFPAGKWLLWAVLLAALAALVIYAAPFAERLLSQTAAPPQEDSNSLELPLSAAPADQQTPEDAGDTAGIPEPQPGNQDDADQAGEDQVESNIAAMVDEQTGAAVNQPDTAAVIPATSTPVEQQPVQPADATLLLRFSADSWVEVKAQGEKLLAGIEAAGSERTIHAVPPVDVLLGNAPAVEVIYNGVPVDTTEYQRGKVARLVLGR